MQGRALWRASFLLTASLCVAAVCVAATGVEYQVKAAFIYKFATYVRWPAAPGVDMTTPFVIGILGKDPFGPALSAVIRGQSIQGRAILIRNVGRFRPHFRQFLGARQSAADFCGIARCAGAHGE